MNLSPRLRRTALIAAGVLFAVGLVAFPRLGPWLVVEDPLDKADAIVVLGGTMYERPLEAVDLYNAGYAPKIFLIRQIPDWGEQILIDRHIPVVREVDIQREALIKLGIPPDAIETIEPSDNTAAEARHVRDLVAARKMSRVIIVTSKQHTRRARLVMQRRLAPVGAQVIMRGTRYDRAVLTSWWWRDRATFRFTMFETQRLLGYWIGAAD